MDGTKSFYPMYFIFALLSLLHVAEVSEGFSIELIHPFSSESPFYAPNITLSEMIKRFSPRSRPRWALPSLNNTWFGSKAIRPVFEYSSRSHLAKLDLGTFPGENPTHKSYYFIFDTGSDLTWLQCEDCVKPGNKCFPQNYPLYPNSKSATYTPLIYGKNQHPLCYPNNYINHHCSYQTNYGDGSYSIGILAYETLAFDSTHTLRVVMGFGIRNKINVHAERSRVGGLLGMSWGPHSFVNQIYTISQGRFSYCLPPLFGHGHHSSVLRFGSDTPSLQSLHSVPIKQYSGEVPYYVKLQGISINSQRLNIPPRHFTKTGNEGGCVLDTGTTYTYIPKAAYGILKDEMIDYLGGADASLKMMSKSKGEFDLCFRRFHPFKGYDHLPRVTFHFEGGSNIVLERDIAFLVVPEARKEVVCMMILPSFYNDIAIIGSQSQANHVFVFDLPSKNVYIGPRDCVQNP